MISLHGYVFLLSYLPFSCGTQCKDLDSGENLVILVIVASWAMDTDYCMDLIEAEDIKKRWQEYIEELYKKDLHDPDNHDGMITA